MLKNLFVWMLAIALATCAFAQTGAGLGSISGLVLDASGAAVPGAAVVVTNESKGIRWNLETTSTSQFTPPALIPNSVSKVPVAHPGFSNLEPTNSTAPDGQNNDDPPPPGCAAPNDT